MVIESASQPDPRARRSRRADVGAALRDRRPLVAAEVVLLLLPLALRLLGVIRNPSLLLFLIGWLSLWLRGEGWRPVGLRRPASWSRTILLGVGIAILYDSLDIFVILPGLRRLTGEPLRLEQFGELRGNVGALLPLLAATWILAAFVEELAYRGYALNRITDLVGKSRAAFLASALAVSLLFGLAHVSQGRSGMLDNVLAGLLFAALYLASGRNLWLPILVHGVVDTTSLLLLFFGFSPP